MTYLDRDSEGLMIPNPRIKDHWKPHHLSVADWGDVFIEIGFVREGIDRHHHLYKHTNDPTLRFRFDRRISQITLSKADEKLAYVYLSTSNSLSLAIGDLLKTIRGLYATDH